LSKTQTLGGKDKLLNHKQKKENWGRVPAPMVWNGAAREGGKMKRVTNPHGRREEKRQ